MKKLTHLAILAAVLIGAGVIVGSQLPASAGGTGGNTAYTVVAFDQLRPVQQQVDLVRHSCNASPRRQARAQQVFTARKARLDAELAAQGFNFSSPELWYIQDFYLVPQGLCPKVMPPGPVG